MKEIYTKPEAKIDEFKSFEVLTASFTGIEEGVGDND